MRSTKLAISGLLKMQTILNKGYDVIICVHDATEKHLSHESSYVVDAVTFSFTFSFIFFLVVCLFVLICFIFILVTTSSFYFFLPSLVLPTHYLISLVTLLCKYKITIATCREDYFKLLSQTAKENAENQGRNYENRKH